LENKVLLETTECSQFLYCLKTTFYAQIDFNSLWVIYLLDLNQSKNHVVTGGYRLGDITVLVVNEFDYFLSSLAVEKYIFIKAIYSLN
jgi:hypothetical protein